MKIFNEFGIKPTTNCKAAGYDFYIPDIKTSPEDSAHILKAFSASYKKSIDELNNLINELYLQVSAVYGEDKVAGQEMNILMLYLALDSYAINFSDDPIERFVDSYLIFDKSGKPGIKPNVLDHVFINSGIHTALEPGTAGIFFNKSGRGTKGWDIRACVIDEDYTGFVHLSLAYTKVSDGDGIIYCGDKLTQMIIFTVGHSEVEEIDQDMYETIMQGSERGANAFGSSNEKH